ncbi:MAG TPA: transglycosylase domain-containing protein, partial [Afifellaceae bacterium]|nr:transglycosylase domain-containing protein [Afifellaceae bacterium]
AAVGVVIYYGVQLPNASTWKVPDRPPNVRIVSIDGQLIGNRGDTGGQAIAFERMPDHLPNAVIAIEDHRFRYHFGLDPIGLSRAMVRNALAGKLVEGGSTLTQQLAKNMFLTPERSVRRKVQELVLAFWLEAKYSKDDILEMYLNRVYFGAGAYGVEAAAKRYFNKSVEEISVPEAAMLASLLKAPSYYSPARDFDRSWERTKLVLIAMNDAGFIDRKQLDEYLGEPPRLATRHLTRSENYVADWVMDRLPSYIGTVNQDVLVETTIDMQLQRHAEYALVENLKAQGEKYGVQEGALVSIDGTGAVRAMVGGRDYSRSQFNRATQALRQPGSAFKPFVYLTALERGMHPQTVRADEPVRIGNWTPENYNKKYRGPVTLRTALALSLNTVAARLAAEVGPENVVSTAHRLGINSPLATNASIALGTSEVTLLEMTGAYSTFANGGFAVLPHVISRITSETGEVIYERQGSGLGRVVSLEHVAMMNNMLQATLEVGTGKRAVIPGWPAAGKTGTTQDFRDAWFVGYTANLTTGVWVGNDSNAPTKRASGSNLPAMVFATFMTEAHNGVEVAALPGTGMMPDYRGQGATLAANDELARDAIAHRSDAEWRREQRRRREGRNGLGGFIRRIFGN